MLKAAFNIIFYQIKVVKHLLNNSTRSNQIKHHLQLNSHGSRGWSWLWDGRRRRSANWRAQVLLSRGFWLTSRTKRRIDASSPPPLRRPTAPTTLAVHNTAFSAAVQCPKSEDVIFGVFNKQQHHTETRKISLFAMSRFRRSAASIRAASSGKKTKRGVVSVLVESSLLSMVVVRRSNRVIISSWTICHVLTAKSRFKHVQSKRTHQTRRCRCRSTRLSSQQAIQVDAKAKESTLFANEWWRRLAIHLDISALPHCKHTSSIVFWIKQKMPTSYLYRRRGDDSLFEM